MSDLVHRPGGGPRENGVPQSWCGRHYERAARHPLLLEQVTVLMFGAFLKDPRTLLFCKADPVKGLTGDEPAILAALEHYSPVCCFFGEEQFTTLWQLAAFGPQARIHPVP